MAGRLEYPPSSPVVPYSSRVLYMNSKKEFNNKQRSAQLFTVCSSSISSSTTKTHLETLDQAVKRIRFLLNQERRTQHLHPLLESTSLDNLARVQATYMAETGRVESAFANQEELSDMLNTDLAVGENVQCGTTPLQLHLASLKTRRSLLLSPLFNEFGLGIARGKDGQLYLCELFRQR